MPFLVITISFYNEISDFNSTIFVQSMMNIRILYMTVAKFPASLTNYLVARGSYKRLNNFIMSKSADKYNEIDVTDDNPISISVRNGCFTWNNNG